MAHRFGMFTDAFRTRRAVATLIFALLLALLAACGLAERRPPSEIPVGGPRASIVREDLEYVREQVAVPLREPTWLPPGFVMTNVSINDSSGTAADLSYSGPDEAYVHIWQTSLENSGVVAPVVNAASDWSAHPLEGGGLELRGRVGDVTITVDGSIGEDALRRVIASLKIRTD